ncbi:MAG: DeoR/GlpR family DNA-binding transcription regulator [Phycisphaeraceae bacterium]
MIEQETATRTPDTRRGRILEVLDSTGEQTVEQLADAFSVSGMTIRRDLQDLAAEGRVIRTHGGAAPTARISFEFRFLQRAQQQAAEKDAIAAVAAELVQPGQAVLLDSGTTTLAIARRLRAIPELTVITTSLPIASELFGVEEVDLILLGGMLRKDAPDLAGAITHQNLDVLRADVAFIGADAVDQQGNLYNSSAELGRMLSRMARSADAAYAVADSSKIGRRELMRFGHLRDWRGLITDRELDAKLRRSIVRAGGAVLQPKRKGGAR